MVWKVFKLFKSQFWILSYSSSIIVLVVGSEIIHTPLFPPIYRCSSICWRSPRNTEQLWPARNTLTPSRISLKEVKVNIIKKKCLYLVINIIFIGILLSINCLLILYLPCLLMQYSLIKSIYVAFDAINYLLMFPLTLFHCPYFNQIPSASPTDHPSIIPDRATTFYTTIILSNILFN